MLWVIGDRDFEHFFEHNQEMSLNLKHSVEAQTTIVVDPRGTYYKKFLGKNLIT